MPEKLKSLLTGENRKKILNLIYSIGAVAIFNMVIQFLVYPDFERTLGPDQYGVALSVLSMIAITAGTFGYAVNCARLLGVEKGRTANSDYNLILLILGVIGSVIGIIYIVTQGITAPLPIILYVLLMVTTMLRYYSEVEFKLNTNCFRYMIYYILISVGYAAGLLLFRVTGEWMLPLIIGEALSVLFVIIFGKIYRKPFIKPTACFGAVVSSMGFIFFSSLIDNITLQVDRILLLSITRDGESVTIYYIASLVGKVISMLTLPINAILISYLVRYNGVLTKKLWTITITAATVFGVLGFGGCLIVSPILIKILYPDMLEKVLPYLISAILGQIFYFVSGMLMMVLLRFRGEKKQLIFNGGYAVIFFSAVAVGTALQGLDGFVYGILIANAIRFIGAIVWGFLPQKQKPQPPSEEVAAETEAAPEPEQSDVTETVSE